MLGASTTLFGKLIATGLGIGPRTTHAEEPIDVRHGGDEA
jgi:hypothetical protein